MLLIIDAYPFGPNLRAHQKSTGEKGDIRLKADQPITHESIWSNGIGPSENCINGRSVQKEVVRACRRSRRQTSIFIANLNFEHPVRNEAIELAVTVIRKSLKSALNIRLETLEPRSFRLGALYLSA